MFNALAEFMAEVHDACKAQCASYLLPEDHPNYEASRKRANQAWFQIVASAKDRGIVAHPKKGWTDGAVKFTIAKAKHPLKFAHFAQAAAPGYAASTQYHTIQGASPDYEELAQSLWPREANRLSSLCTNRQNWLCDAMPNQVKPSTYRVGESHYYVIPLWDTVDGEAKVVACEGFWRPKNGMGFRAHWVLPLGAVNTDIIDAALIDAHDNPDGERIIKAPWDLISLAERHAFGWAKQWAERLAMDDEHSWGVPPGETVETVGPTKRSKRTRSRTAYEAYEEARAERPAKPHVKRPPSGIDPWARDERPRRSPDRSVRTTRVDPAALRAACESADREQAIRALMDDFTTDDLDRAAHFQGWSVGPDEQW